MSYICILERFMHKAQQSTDRYKDIKDVVFLF